MMNDFFEQDGALEIGADLIASLSIGLYNNPLSVYRELVQNSADAYQEAGTPPEGRKIDITIDRKDRMIKVRDFATGLNSSELAGNVLTIGRSHKRGLGLRGFRGIGRLAALGFCKTVIFRSRKSVDDVVHEVIWNATEFRKHLSSELPAGIGGISDFISLQPTEADIEWPETFFECEMQHVLMTNRDMLLNRDLVAGYLMEHCPVPFADDFPFEHEIRRILGEGNLFDTLISINGGHQLCRPHTDSVVHPVEDRLLTSFDFVEPIHELDELTDPAGLPLARGWIIDHDLPGALPSSSLVGGLRARIGNMQIGSNRIFDGLFKEPRFNQWLVGEIHILTPSIRPDTRREEFELSAQLEDLTNALEVFARRMTTLCRERSVLRKRQRPQLTTRRVEVDAGQFEKFCQLTNVNNSEIDELTIYRRR